MYITVVMLSHGVFSRGMLALHVFQMIRVNRKVALPVIFLSYKMIILFSLRRYLFSCCNMSNLCSCNNVDCI